MKKQGAGGVVVNHFSCQRTYPSRRPRSTRSLLADGSTRRVADDSKGEIGDLDEQVGVEHTFAPDGVEVGERFFCDGFLDGFSRGLQLLNAIAGGDKHVPEFRKVR